MPKWKLIGQGRSALRSHLALMRLGDPEVLNPAAGLQSGNKPSRLLATSRPGFRGLCRILIFWDNHRIRPTGTLVTRGSRFYLGPGRRLHNFSAIELDQPVFELALFRDNPFG